jgi:hypothetical protein
MTNRTVRPDFIWTTLSRLLKLLMKETTNRGGLPWSTETADCGYEQSSSNAKRDSSYQASLAVPSRRDGSRNN